MPTCSGRRTSRSSAVQATSRYGSVVRSWPSLVWGLAFIVGLTIWILVWNSGLAPTTTADIKTVVGDDVTYEYTVDGTTYTDTERSNRVSFSQREGKQEEIRYLRAVPSWSMLGVNIERMEWVR